MNQMWTHNYLGVSKCLDFFIVCLLLCATDNCLNHNIDHIHTYHSYPPINYMRRAFHSHTVHML